ncbi:MAG: tail fiber domain-containing protein [Flavobacteriales bacterium]
MKTLRTLRYLLIAALLGIGGNAFAQTDILGHGGGLGYYLGWDAGAPQSLDIKHRGNYPIDFYTADILRMRLNPSVSYPVGTFPSAPRMGFVGISGRSGLFSGFNGPFTRLHLADDEGANNPSVYAQTFGYRPWMRNGITFTGNSDQAYEGQKFNGEDRTDLIFQWSDNAGGDPNYGPDRLRFLFTSTPTGAPSGSGSLDGLEALRMWPKNANEVNVGIGDFAATTTDPTERLHLLTGRLRLEQLPDDPIAPPTLLKFLVVDDTDPTSSEYGVIKWRNVPPGTGGGCEWTLLGIPGSNSNIATAYNLNPGCPQGDKRVGIGTNNPGAKLGVESKIVEGGPVNGLLVKVLNQGGGGSIGMESMVTTDNGSPASQPEAIRGTSLNGTITNTGILGRATMSSANGCDQNQAVIGEALVTNGIVGTNRAGSFRAEGTSAVDNNVASENVSIGGKYSVGVKASATNTSQDLSAIGLNASATGSASKVFGTSSKGEATLGAGVSNAYGIYAQGSNAVTNFGVDALANGGATNYGVRSNVFGAPGTLNYGVRAYANGGGAGSTNYGVWAQAQFGTTNWAGYFAGHVQITGNLWNGVNMILSDETLKTDVQELDGNLENLLLLSPKRFHYTDAAQNRMGLPATGQIGFIAQEVEELFPELVSSTVIAAMVDSMGNETAPAMQVKGVNYVGLTPLLVLGYQEQRTQLSDLQTTNAALTDELQELNLRMDQLEQSLIQCCAAQGQGMAPNNGDQRNAPAEELKEQRLLIIPNPVADLTTLRYYVPQAGQVSLQVSSADGKPMETLREEKAEAGEFSYTWNTTQLAAGTYFCTLMVEGNVVVKRAVKVK